MRWIFLFLICGSSLLHGQMALSKRAALEGIYGEKFDPATGKVTWHCPQQKEAAPDGCAFVGDATSAPQILLSALVEVENADVPTTYVVTSASGQLGCHACAPVIGMGVFEYRKGQWVAESAKSDIVRFGAWGEPPDITLVMIGQHSYGAMLTLNNGGQGYFATTAILVASSEKTVTTIWQGVLDEDNSGDFDPTGRDGSPIRIHVDAAYTFLAPKKGDFFDLEVISRGYGYGNGREPKSRNATELFRFSKGKYSLISRTEYRELPMK